MWCVLNGLYQMDTMERKLCIDFGIIMFEMFNKSVIISLFSKLSTTADNLLTRTIQINSWMDERARITHQWPLVNHTIPNTILIYKVSFWFEWVWVWVLCIRRTYATGHCLCLRCGEIFFLLKSNYLTRSKWGESNYHYTCYISNQWISIQMDFTNV